MLAGACFGHYAWLAHSLYQQSLPNGVVNLMGARVSQVFALQVNLPALQAVCQAPCEVEGRGAADVVRQQRV